LIKREAELSKLLVHPNVVSVSGYKFLRRDETNYHCILMEYIDGEDLDKRLQKGPMSLHDVLYFGWCICNALVYTHAQKVVHRDLKPQNVLIKNNVVKVADFGLASAVSRSIITLSSVLGTPLYLSPEQAKNEKGDERSDMYSLGVIMYQMIAGQAPFEGPNEHAIILKHLTEMPIPITQLRKNIPVRLEALVDKAMSKSPNARFQSAIELQKALEEIAQEEGIDDLERPTPTSSLKRMFLNWSVPRLIGIVDALASNLIWVVLVSAIGFLLFIFGAMRGLGINPTVLPTQTVPILTSTTSSTPAPTNRPQPTITPKSPTSTLEPSVETPIGGSMGVLAFNCGTNICLINADGTGQTLVTQHGGSLAWHPDGTRIAFDSTRSGISQIYVINVDGSGLQQLTNSPENGSLPFWSPDGTRIVFQSNRDGNNEIYVMNADGTVQIRLTNNQADDGLASWSPDETQIAFVSNRDGNSGIYVMNTDSTGLTRITDVSMKVAFPDWSPDGTRIAFNSNVSGNDEIYIINTDGTNLIQLTNNPWAEDYPSWSPDGKKIAYDSARDGTWNVWIMNADGTGQTPLTTDSATNFAPDWQPQ